MISLDRLEIPNLGFSRIFVIARIRYKNRCELINILFNLHQSVHPLLGPYNVSKGRRVYYAYAGCEFTCSCRNICLISTVRKSVVVGLSRVL